MKCFHPATRARAVELANAHRTKRGLRAITWHHLSRAGRAHFGAMATAENRLNILNPRGRAAA